MVLWQLHLTFDNYHWYIYDKKIKPSSGISSTDNQFPFRQKRDGVVLSWFRQVRNGTRGGVRAREQLNRWEAIDAIISSHQHQPWCKIDSLPSENNPKSHTRNITTNTYVRIFFLSVLLLTLRLGGWTFRQLAICGFWSLPWACSIASKRWFTARSSSHFWTEIASCWALGPLTPFLPDAVFNWRNIMSKCKSIPWDTNSSGYEKLR